MLQLFHRYQKHVLGFALIAVIALSMTGFGIDMLMSKPQIYAIKIDKHEITPEEFYAEKRRVEQRYRSMFGKSFDQFAKTLNLNISQQVADSLISRTLTDQLTTTYGFEAGVNEYDQVLKTQIFPQGYNPELYRAMLQQSNMTDAQFRSTLDKEVVRNQFVSLIKDLSQSSLKEAQANYAREETKYNVRYLAVDPQKFTAATEEPNTEQIESYYKDHESDFTLPERISYEYINFAPINYQAAVVVQEEDLEIFYSDNQSKYMQPEQVHVRHIQFNFPTENDPAKMSAVKTLAQKVYEKAQTGQSFDSLVLEYSDDITTKSLGGDLGWLTRGRRAKQFDDAAFKLKTPGIAELVETDYGYHIIKVEQYKAEAQKPFAEVREQIESQFRSDEAPSYAAEKANAVYERIKKGEQLTDIIKAENLSIESSKEPLAKDQDPAADLKGLTAKVLESGVSTGAALIDLPDRAVIAFVKERKEVELKPLADVRAEIITALKAADAQKIAKAKTEEALVQLKEGKLADLKAAAKALNTEVQEEKDLMPVKSSSGILAIDGVKQMLLKSTVAANIPHQVITNAGKYYLIATTAITAPDLSKAASDIEKIRSSSSDKNAEILMTALIEREKAVSEIEVREGFIGQE